MFGGNPEMSFTLVQKTLKIQGGIWKASRGLFGWEASGRPLGSRGCHGRASGELCGDMWEASGRPLGGGGRHGRLRGIWRQNRMVFNGV